jgi:chorismate lyase/3-hydroxybenzoate synthase
VRLWNFIPGILEPLGELPHRYMVFNAGRFAAYTRWYRHRDRFDRYVATASGVGHAGEDLVIHCLAARSPGMPVENPRQVAAYRYSARYGPQPPCFARATRLDARGARSLLVGGTASVRGEDSLYAGDVAAQIEETLRNLAAVAAAGAVAARPAGAADEAREGELERYRSLRVYHVRDEDLPGIRAAVAASFRRLELLELVSADLCRPELLVEIEGIADLASPVADELPPALTLV